MGTEKPSAVDIETKRAKWRANQDRWRRHQGHLTWAEYIFGKQKLAAERKHRRDLEKAAKKEQRRLKVLANRAVRREKVRQQSRAWRLAHPDRMRELLRAWKKANPEKRRLHRSGRASNNRRRKYLYELQGGKCAICHQKLGKDVHIDHIIPRSAGGPNCRSNLQLVHPACNYAKRDHDPIDFSRSLGRLL